MSSIGPFYLLVYGIELELVVCDDNGNYVEGDNMVRIMKEMVTEANKVITDIINKKRADFPPIPDFFRQKITKMPYLRQDLEKGIACVLESKIDNQYLKKNVAADIFFLEMEMLPCPRSFWS